MFDRSFVQEGAMLVEVLFTQTSFLIGALLTQASRSIDYFDTLGSSDALRFPRRCTSRSSVPNTGVAAQCGNGGHFMMPWSTSSHIREECLAG